MLNGYHRGFNPTQTMLTEYIAKEKPDLVLISADWSAQDVEPLRETVAFLNKLGQRVAVRGQGPEYELPLPRLLAFSGDNDAHAVVENALLPQSKSTDASFAQSLRGSGTDYVSVYQIMCSTACATIDDAGTPLQFDTGHFTDAGSVWLAARLRETNAIRLGNDAACERAGQHRQV